MGLDDQTRAELKLAGASWVEFNSPMSKVRAAAICGFAASAGASMLDLGCGYGKLALLAGAQHRELDVVGVDSDALAIEHGRALVVERGLEGRVRFEVGDAGVHAVPLDVAVSIGSSHAFGGTREMFASLRSLGVKGAVVGDMVWTGSASSGLKELFGELPVGSEGLAVMASEAGWVLEDASLSSMEEWDKFEGGWIEGVRRVGTIEAETFADERAEFYQEYRGIAGFGWLYLTQQVGGLEETRLGARGLQETNEPKALLVTQSNHG